MKTRRRRMNYLVAVVMMMCGISYFLFFYAPISRDIENYKDQIEKAEEAAARADDLMAENRKLKEKADRLKTEIERIQKALSKGYDEPDLVVHLYEITKDLCDRESLVIQEAVSHDNFISLPVHISFRTSYDELKKLFRTLEGFSFTNSIKNFSILSASMEGQSQKSRNLSVDLMLEFYFGNQVESSKKEYSFMEGEFGNNQLFTTSPREKNEKGSGDNVSITD